VVTPNKKSQYCLNRVFTNWLRDTSAKTPIDQFLIENDGCAGFAEVD